MQLQKYIYQLLWVIVSLVVLSEGAIASPLILNGPKKAQQGTAIIVTAISSTPVSNAVFSWLKQKITVPFKCTNNRWEAQTILPIPVDAQKCDTLTVQAGKNRVHHTISIEKVHWPKQIITMGKKKHKYVKPSQELTDRLKKERDLVQQTLSKITPCQYWSKPFVRPITGIITSCFGGQRVFNGKACSYHQGVDLRGAVGTPIKAMATGKVTIAKNLYYLGKAVFIDHGQGIYTLYGHMSRCDVKVGDLVVSGQQIGLVGATGRATGPHLHLGLKIFGYPVDPMSLFPN